MFINNFYRSLSCYNRGTLKIFIIKKTASKKAWKVFPLAYACANIYFQKNS